MVFTGSVGYTYHPEPHPLGISHTNQLQPLLEHLVQLVESSGLEGLQGDTGAGMYDSCMGSLYTCDTMGPGNFVRELNLRVLPSYLKVVWV